MAELIPDAAVRVLSQQLARGLITPERAETILAELPSLSGPERLKPVSSADFQDLTAVGLELLDAALRTYRERLKSAEEILRKNPEIPVVVQVDPVLEGYSSWREASRG